MTSLTYTKATIFGAGQVGMTLMEQLVQQGVAVTLVNRRGQAGEALPAGATIVAGDLTDASTVAHLAKDAEVVFATAQPDYTQWPEKWPPLMQSLIGGMAQTNARLVFVDNLYMYGPTHGKPIREDLPYAATGRKGKTRAQIATMLLDAHKAGKVRATIGRARISSGRVRPTPPSLATVSLRPPWRASRQTCLATPICRTPIPTCRTLRGR